MIVLNVTPQKSSVCAGSKVLLNIVADSSKDEELFSSLFIPNKEVKESVSGLHFLQELAEVCMSVHLSRAAYP